MGLLLIYDFDGVIADSEVVANAVLAEMVVGAWRADHFAGRLGLCIG